MTEITPERDAVLLADVSRLIYKALRAWPEEFPLGHLAAIIAKGGQGVQKAGYGVWYKHINDAINAGHLTVRTKEHKSTTRARLEPTGARAVFAGMPASVAYTKPANTQIHVLTSITRAAAAQWLRRLGPDLFDIDKHAHVAAWLGPIWQEEAPKVGAGKTAPAPDSRPGERRDYFRSLWLEFGKPVKNREIWKTMQQRRGSDGCPIVSVTGNEEFVFRYSDKATDRLERSQFQKDMSAVRAAERKG